MFFARQPHASELLPGSPSQRLGRTWRPLVILGVIVLVAVGCSDDDVSPDASAETTVTSSSTSTAAPATTTTVTSSTTTTAPATTTTVAPIEVPTPTDVTETYSIPDFGYSIDYPSGWFAETRGTATLIVPTEEALADGFSNLAGPVEGLGVTLFHQTPASIGFDSDDPTAEDLVEFNTASLGWTDVRDTTDVEIFGGPAIRARVTLAEGLESINYQGVRTDTGEAFLLSFGARTRESLDEFLPTWSSMFESITALE